ncbi:collagen-like protein [Rathayibacter sp. VKM Ac-2801]|uniref:collagen-like protein n=1 Tax=Rathayibacter sp. VKM Ac-2801 TaxID=2609255 RepID=UPI001FC96745|nr:collagen-like protein [Rathayibacter sp. VKM Ac-2801]
MTQWSDRTAYRAGPPSSVVAFGGGAYVAVTDNRAVSPAAGTGAWVQIAAPGARGPEGIVGPQGLQGLQGLQGARGADGTVGAAGATGAQGVKGDTGAAGPQGVKGDTGAAGPSGAQGVKGDTGATGPQGPAGPVGAEPEDTSLGFPDGCAPAGSPLITFAFDTRTIAVDGKGFCSLTEYLGGRADTTTVVDIDTATIATEFEKALNARSVIPHVTVQLGAVGTCDASTAPCRRPGGMTYAFDSVTVDAISISTTGDGSATFPLIWEKMTVSKEGSRLDPVVDAAGNGNSTSRGGLGVSCRPSEGIVRTLTVSSVGSTKPILSTAVLGGAECFDFTPAGTTILQPLRTTIADPRGDLLSVAEGSTRRVVLTTTDSSTGTTSTVDLTARRSGTISGGGVNGDQLTVTWVPLKVTQTITPANGSPSTFSADYTKP